MKLSDIPKDKLLHYFYGSIAGILGLAVAFVYWSQSGIVRYEFPILAAAFAGSLKEWRDYKGAGQVEFLDFVYTVAGALPLTCGFLVAVVMLNV